MTERWVRVAPCDWVPPREGRSVRIGDREIALFNVGVGGADDFLATDNQCPHKGGPLCDGIVAGRSVVCPLHAWKIDLDHGTVDRPAGAGLSVPTYPTRVEGGIVMVCLPVERLPARHQHEIVQICQIVRS